MYSTAVLAHLLLAVAWPFATISGWTVCSRVRTSKRALIAIAISLVIGLILWLIDAKVVHGAIPVGSDVLIRWSWFTILLVNTAPRRNLTKCPIGGVLSVRPPPEHCPA